MQVFKMSIVAQDRKQTKQIIPKNNSSNMVVIGN